MLSSYIFSGSLEITVCIPDLTSNMNYYFCHFPGHISTLGHLTSFLPALSTIIAKEVLSIYLKLCKTLIQLLFIWSAFI